MLATRNQFKVLNSIITFNPIDMMNMFTFFKFSSKMFFHNASMLKFLTKPFNIVVLVNKNISSACFSLSFKIIKLFSSTGFSYFFLCGFRKRLAFHPVPIIFRLSYFFHWNTLLRTIFPSPFFYSGRYCYNFFSAGKAISNNFHKLILSCGGRYVKYC